MSDGANSVAVQDDLGFRPAGPQVRASAADNDLGFRPASVRAQSGDDDLGFRPAAPSYSLTDLGTPSRTALGPGVASQFEEPYTAVPGVFGEPEFSEASKQRIARERIDQGWKIKAAPSGVGPWLENLEADIRYGTGYTAPGRVLHAMGAEGIDVGNPPAVGEILGGPFIGPVRAVRGLKQALGPYAGEPADVQSEVRGLNEALRGTMQAVAPVAAATNPAFIPTIAPYAIGGNLAETGLRKIGVPPEEAELASNIALIGGGLAHAGITEPRAPFGGTYEHGAWEPVVKGDTVPDHLKGTTDKTAAAVENARRLERPPARSPEEIKLGLRPAETQRAQPSVSPAASPSPNVEKVIATPYQQRIANLSMARLRNPVEREYAQSYLKARLQGEAEPTPIASLSKVTADYLRRKVDDALKTQESKPLDQRYAPDVLEEAANELKAAQDLASTFDKPGRFPIEAGAFDERFVNAQDRNKWMGIKSSRNMVTDMFPWYSDEKITPAMLTKAAQKGKGAEYVRIVEKIAESIVRDRELAKPIIHEYQPELLRLSEEVKGIDPELSRILTDVAEGRYSARAGNLRKYIEEKVADANAARDFSQAIDAAATEERQAGTEEPARPAVEARPPSSQPEAPPSIEPPAAKFTAEVYQGKGATPEQIYGKEAVESGRAYPVLGHAKYFATIERDAKRFGAVSKHTVELRNPFVLDSDVKWRELVRDAQTPHLSSVNREFYTETSRVPEMAERLQSYLRSRGFDGVVVEIAEQADVNKLGEPIKRLRETFDHSQVVKFGEAAPSTTRGVLPGMEQAVKEQAEGAARVQGEELTRQTQTPQSIEAAAGEMETKSPLFRGTEASPQNEMFAPGGKTAGGGGGGSRASVERIALPSLAELKASESVGGQELTRRSEILRTLSQKLGDLPIRTGRFSEKALGIYKIEPEAVRLKYALSLSTAFHEVGHHINKLLWGTYVKPMGAIDLNWKPLKDFRSELNPKNGLGYRPSGRSYLPESFADFIRYYVQHPDKARTLAPRFYQFFESEVKRVPELRDILLDARQKTRRYIAQPASAKILSHISKEDTPQPINRFETFYTYMMDALRPIQRAVNEMRGTKGLLLNTEQNAYELARLLAGWWGKADHFLKRGTFEPNTLQVTGKPLQEILRPWEGKLDDVRVYLVAKRTIEKVAQGKQTGVSPEDAAESIKELETPEMLKLAEDLQTYNDSLLSYLRDSGYLNKEQYTQIRAMNKNYAPFYRVMEEKPATAAGGGKKTFADLWSPVKRMRGSTREIVDPLESIVKNTYTFINLAERNRVAMALVNQAARTEGSAKWVEKLPTPKQMTKFELEEIYRALVEAGLEPAESSGGKALLGANGEPINLETVAMVFRPQAFAPKGENIVTVFENGKRGFYQLQPDLYKAIKGLDVEQTEILTRILSVPARLLRLGATGLGPEFVIRNPIRDAWTAFLQSRNGFIPGVDTFRGLFHALKSDDLYWEWKRAGGEHAAMLSLDRTKMQQHLNDLLRSKVGYAVRHPVETLRLFSEFGESATRLGEFGRARARGQEPRQAALASREVTLDFARMGAKTRAVNSIVAFWNAAVQGTDKFVRMHLENPKGTLAKAIAGVTIPSILLYLVNKDDPTYQQLPRWEKDFFWHVPTKGTRLKNKTPFVLIPKPFLWGMVYGSMPERVMEWLNERDPAALDGLLKNLGEASLPGMVPTAAIPLMETWANKSYFRGVPLVPEYMKGLTPEQQAHPYTTEFSKKTATTLGKAGIHVSPIQLDNAIFGYTGGMGRAVLRAPDFLGKGRQAVTAADVPVVRAFVPRFPSGQMESIQRFYDRLEELERKYATQRFAVRYPGGAEGGETMALAERQELGRLRAVNRQMQFLNQQIRRAQFSDEGAEAKQKKIRESYLRMAEITKQALHLNPVTLARPSAQGASTMP